MLPQWRVNQVARLGAGRRRAHAGARRRAGGGAMSRYRNGARSRVGKRMTAIARLKIWRGESADAAGGSTTQVPFEPGQSVLDGLRWIRANSRPVLAIRFSCINANACKECMIELDGETVYACTARLEPREMTLAPLSNKQLVRDLVTEIAPPAERFLRR